MRDDAPSVGHPSLATSSSGQLPPGMHVCATIGSHSIPADDSMHFVFLHLCHRDAGTSQGLGGTVLSEPCVVEGSSPSELAGAPPQAAWVLARACSYGLWTLEGV